MSDITIPSNVTSIGSNAFDGCNEFSDVYCSGTRAQWGAISVDDIWNEPLDAATILCTDGDIVPEGVNPTVLPQGVKCVPYSCRAENENFTNTPDDPGWGLLHYELVGTLSSGLSLDPKTVVISGVPMASGTWSFTAKRIFPHSEDEIDRETVLKLPWTLTVLSNTDAAVKEPNEYTIIDPVGRPSGSDPNHFYKTEYSDERIVIDGPYADFYRLRIDGVVLHEPEDYTSKEGSTVIMILSQTFRRFVKGTHTISAEYRENRDPKSPLKQVAQNYTLTIDRPSSGESSGGGSSFSDGASDDDHRPSTAPNSTKPKPKLQKPEAKPSLPFTDVSPRIGSMRI